MATKQRETPAPEPASRIVGFRFTVGAATYEGGDVAAILAAYPDAVITETLVTSEGGIVLEPYDAKKHKAVSTSDAAPSGEPEPRQE